MSLDLVFVAAKRSPFGAFGGSFSKLSATELSVAASAACLSQINAKGSDIDAVVMGNVLQSSVDAIYLARHVGLKIGMSIEAPALTVNRLCGSGFEAIAQGAYLILQEGMKSVLVGGTENMTQVPYVLRGARAGYRMGNGEVEDYLTASLVDSYTGLPMAITAENLAVQYSISRAQVDAFSLKSQQRAAAAQKEGRLEAELSAIEIFSKKGKIRIEKDEHLRPDTTLEALAKLKPMFKSDGIVTAGSASGIVDGACSLILTTQKEADRRKWKVLGRLMSWASKGCDPKIMGIGPVPATHSALERYRHYHGVSKTISDFKLIEVNEAFAAQYLAVEKELGLNPDKTNIDGGAIAIGHPLAASGARLVTHLLYALTTKGGGLGLATACIGGGQGMSVIVEV